MAIPGVILAGGLARRMGGGDKGRLMLGGKSLMAHVITRLAPQCGPVALNANADPSRFSDLKLPVIADTLPGHPGPLAGVLAGLDWAAGIGAGAIVTAAADTPFLPETLVADLSRAADSTLSGMALAATEEGGRVIRHPTFGLWPVALRADLRAALQDGIRKVVVWTDRHDAATAVFPTDAGDPFFNVNTPEDLVLAEARVA